MKAIVSELAARCGVAPSTVRNIMSGTGSGGRYSEKTQELVRKMAREYGYQPSRLASAFRAQRAATVGILARRTADVYDLELMDWLTAGMAERRIETLVEFDNSETAEQARATCRSFLSWQFEACMLFGIRGVQPEDAVGASKKTFIVRVNRGEKWPGCSSVRINREERIGIAVKHLVELGHERIGALVVDHRSSYAKDRLKQFRDALAEHGLKLREEDVHSCGCPIPRRVGMMDQLSKPTFELAGRFASEKKRPTALIGLYNAQSNWFVSALISKGMSVPGDLSVVSISETAQARTCVVPLTTVGVHLHDYAEATLDLVTNALKRRSNGGNPRQRHLVMEPVLRVRATSGPPE